MPRHGSPPSSQGSPPPQSDDDDDPAPDGDGPLTANEEAQLAALLRRLDMARRAPDAADGLTSAASTAAGVPPTGSTTAPPPSTGGAAIRNNAGSSSSSAGDLRHYAVWHIPGADNVFGVFTGQHPVVWTRICQHLPGGRYPGSGARLRRTDTLLDAITLYRSERARNMPLCARLPDDPPIYRF